MILVFLQVALGGAIGSTARYGISLLSARWAATLPWGTLTVNVGGSFMMGVVASFIIARGGQGLAPFIMTGCLGGFTTFSAFSLDVLSLWQDGQAGWAILYILASVGLSILAVAGGFSFGRMI